MVDFHFYMSSCNEWLFFCFDAMLLIVRCKKTKPKQEKQIAKVATKFKGKCFDMEQNCGRFQVYRAQSPSAGKMKDNHKRQQQMADGSSPKR